MESPLPQPHQLNYPPDTTCHTTMCAGTATTVFVLKHDVTVPAHIVDVPSQHLSMDSGWLIKCVAVPAQLFVDVLDFS